ncbi:hypothetical protein RclHR1_04000004 [Rhizophagus clarus]|uniref:Uncharacterized protein n=1 Tax=Rhizophagus clarus TaxID=94130 RepID=A0A2Z6RIG4_9GLOM|nr:hypothetical protein RclHR1_04000004 [Rhizophagus clarus]
MTYHFSRPHSVYAQSNHQPQLSSGQRPYSVVGYEGYEGLSSLQQQPSFRVIRRRHQRRNVRNNSNSWLKEYEGYRQQVLNAEKSSTENTRPVSCYSSSLVSSPSTMEYQRYSMQF